MAFFVLASVLQAIETVLIFAAVAFSLQVLSNVLGPGVQGPRLSDLTVQVSTYGNAISRIFGDSMRMAGNVIWSSGLIETKHKKGGFLTPKVTTYTYSTSVAVALCARTFDEGPIEGISKIWANGKLIFDEAIGTPGTEVPTTGGGLGSIFFALVNGSHATFADVTLYGGSFEQDPDPTIEAEMGVGQAPAYRGTAYAVIRNLQLKDFGNRLPNLEFLVRGKTGQTLAEVVDVICGEAGIDDDHDMSSTALAAQTVRGYALGRAMTCWDALKPLQMAYYFEAAEQQGQIRFMRRAQNPRGVIQLSDMAAHVFGDERPATVTYNDTIETAMPREFSVSFLDPDRDWQVNTQSERRSEGSAESNVSVELPMALTPSEGRGVAGRGLWQQVTGRRGAKIAVTDKWIGVEAGRIYSIPTPLGTLRHLVKRRTRGANGIIELELVRDESAAYTFDTAGSDAPTPTNPVGIPGPVTDAVIFEPKTSLTEGRKEIWLGVTGGPDWQGAQVWLSTDDVNFTLMGQITAPAALGELTAGLAAYGGVNPDALNTLSVDMSASGETLEDSTATDAAIGQPLYYVGGEYLSAEDITSTGTDLCDADTLWRGLYGSDPGAHLSGERFLRLDGAVFTLPNLPEYVGATLYFRFVGVGETVSTATSWTFAPSGGSFGGGTGGVPTQPQGLAATGGIQSAVLAWTANPGTDNVSGYEIWRAPCLAASFGSASRVATVGGGTLTYNDVGLGVATSYTWFVVAVNAVGSSPASAGDDATTSGTAIGGVATSSLTASEAITAPALVNVWNSSGEKIRKADNSAAGKPAHGFILASVAMGADADVYFEGSFGGHSSLTPGATYYLGAAGAVTATAPSSSGNVVQPVGVAIDDQVIDFEAGQTWVKR